MLEVNKIFFFSWSFRWAIIATKGGEAFASSSTLEPVLGLLLLEGLRWVQSRSAMQTWYGSFLPFARLLSPFYLIYHKLSRISAQIISSLISSHHRIFLHHTFCKRPFVSPFCTGNQDVSAMSGATGTYTTSLSHRMRLFSLFKRKDGCIL